MVDVKPFCAWRYDNRRVNPAHVVAPPYDVIDAEEQNRLYQKSPYNIIRLILGKEEPEAGFEEKDKYRRAADYLSAWRQEKILIREESPAFYLYRQTYPHPETNQPVCRTGVFVTLKLESFETRAVLPHERTHSAPKVDRMNLIRAVEGNMSPVFGLYEDRERILDPIFQGAAKDEPLYSFVDDKRVKHELWRIDGEEPIQKIATFFKTQSIMIADGHHRYETALAYRDDIRQKHARANGALPSDYVMMALVNIHDQGLLVFPTHRLLKLPAVPDAERLEKILAPCFSINGFHVSDARDWEPYLNRDPKDRVVIGIQWGKTKARLYVLRDENYLKTVMPKGKPDGWYRLDVNIVSHLIIEKMFGIESARLEEVVFYTRSLEEAVDRLQKEKETVGIILRTPDVATVKAVCYSGEVMPQKSTYFYPKLPSGLLMYSHERSV